MDSCNSNEIKYIDQTYKNQVCQLQAMKTVKKFFAQFDMFSVPPTLRSNEEPETSSLCSGVTSFLLALFFSYVFILSTVKVVTYENINSIQTQSRKGFEEVTGSNVFFGIRVGYLPIQISQKYFDVGFYIVYENGTNSTYPMQQCTAEQWKDLGNSYQSQYTKFSLGDFFCPRPENRVDLKKVFYAPRSQYAAIFVRPCTTSGKSICQTQANQQQFIGDLSAIEGAIFISIYILDQAINPSSKIPVSRFLNTDSEFSFTTKRGIIATIELGSYNVQTDLSVFPVEELETIEGNFLHSFRQTSIQINTVNDNFAMIYFSLNRKHILVERTVGKLDDMLSYAGGLFSIITGFLGLFVVSFNKYRYELMVAEGVFHEDEDGNRIRQNDFTFPRYIKYSLFDWLGTLFCYEPQWKDCIIIESTRDEANKQMDVTRLFRKIEGLQYSIYHLMDEKQRECLTLLKPQSLGRIKRNRLLLEYYNIIIQNKTSLNFEQHRISTQILKFGMMLMKNEASSSNNPNRVENMSFTQSDFLGEEFQIDYDALRDYNYLIEVVETHFKQIKREAEEIKLEEQQQEIQLDLAEAFFELAEEKREKLQVKIPIKILYRLAKRYKRFKTNDSEQKVSKKQKVVLNIIESPKKDRKSILNILDPPKVYDFGQRNEQEQ